MLQTHNTASTQDCHNYTNIHGLESWQTGKNHENHRKNGKA